MNGKLRQILLACFFISFIGGLSVSYYLNKRAEVETNPVENDSNDLIENNNIPIVEEKDPKEELTKKLEQELIVFTGIPGQRRVNNMIVLTKISPEEKTIKMVSIPYFFKTESGQQFDLISSSQIVDEFLIKNFNIKSYIEFNDTSVWTIFSGLDKTVIQIGDVETNIQNANQLTTFATIGNFSSYINNQIIQTELLKTVFEFSSSPDKNEIIRTILKENNLKEEEFDALLEIDFSDYSIETLFIEFGEDKDIYYIPGDSKRNSAVPTQNYEEFYLKIRSFFDKSL